MDQGTRSTPARLSNSGLLATVERLAQGERDATVELIIHLAELEARRLYLREGCSPLFAYCASVLRLSEHGAYRRIEAARTGRRFPAIFEMREGAVNLTTVCMLAAHLTHENHRRLLDAASHKSKRQVEELIARWRPRPAVPATVRKLPVPRRIDTAPVASDGEVVAQTTSVMQSEVPDLPAPPLPATPQGPAHPAVVAPLAPDRYRIQFTASPETRDKLRLAQDLPRQQIPDGDPAKIFDRALTVLVEQLVKSKLAATAAPSWPPPAGAMRREAFWSSTMLCPMPSAAGPPQTPFSCVAGRITTTRLNCGSVPSG